MSEYEGEARPLPWPLKNPLVYSRTTEEDTDCEVSSFVWPEDSDERVPVVFNLSLNEYVVLASTIDVGSDVAYGVDAIRVWWLWDRAMRCPMSLCDAIINAIDTCPDLQDYLIGFIGNAIGNAPTVQQQIRDFITGDEYLNDYLEFLVAQGAISNESQNRNMLKPAACDSGYLFNQAFVAEDVLKNLSVNVFSAMSVGANAVEWAQAAVTIMPIVGGILPAIGITAFAAYFVETFYTEYAVQWTAQKDAIICMLWCKIEETCELSLNDLIQFHMDQSGLSLPEYPIEAFKAIVEMITSGSFANANVVHGMHLLMLTAMRLNMTLLGIDFASYAISITAGGDTSDDGYLDCDACQTPFTLQAGIGYPTALVFKGYDGYDKVYWWTSTYTGNYATGSLFEVDSVPFRVRSMQMVVGEFNAGAGLGNAGEYDLDTFPYDSVEWIAIGMYNLIAGNVIEMRVYAT